MIEDEIKDLEANLTIKFNQLLNLYKEKRSLEEFVKENKMSDDYNEWRKIFYQNRSWK